MVGSYFARLFFQNKDYIIKHSSGAAEIQKNKDFRMKTIVLFDFDCFFNENSMILLILLWCLHVPA